MQKNNIIPNSYVRPASPKAQYQELNNSLAAQVLHTRQNLLGILDVGPIPFADESMMAVSKDVVPKGATNEQEDDECIKVYLKIRPFKEEEMGKKEDKNCIEVKSSTTIRAHPPPESTTYKNNIALHGSEEREYKFIFTRVFPAETTQKQFFDDTTQQFIRNLLMGQDALLFSYGVTNGGKTFTFQGTEAEPGLIPRSLDQLFQTLKDKLVVEPELMPKMFGDCEPMDVRKRQEMKATKAALWKFLDTGEFETMFSQTGGSTGTFMTAESSLGSSMGSSQSSLQSLDEDNRGTLSRQNSDSSLVLPADYRCSVWVSFVEVYNEQVYDLLVPLTGAKGKDRPTLKVSEDRRGNVYVKGAGEYFITSVEEAIRLVMVGRRNLQIAATKLNYNSSRSHCIYGVRLLKKCIRSDGSLVHQLNRLSFCDLAGSERTSKIEGGSERVKETGSINASLLTLGRCITALRWNQTHKNQPQIIPYRESKLTRLFQHCLNGRAQTCMVVNINQCASCFDETLNVLKFSAVAKEIKTIKEPVSLPAAVVSPPPAKFSLLWKEIRERKQTIGWASTIGSATEAAASAQSLSEPLPDDEEEAEDQSILDKTLDENNEIIQQYLKIINDLKTQLIAERQKNFVLETQIREEVCNEYGKLYREMERHYMDDKEEAVADAEQLAEDRMELFVQTVKKRRKTEGRVVMGENDGSGGGDEDAWVPAEHLEAKEKECAELRKEIQLLKKEQSAATEGESSKGETSATAYLDDIASLKRSLEKKERQIQDLTETVEEAGKKFEEQESRIIELEAKNEMLEKALAKSKGQSAVRPAEQHEESAASLKSTNKSGRKVATEGLPPSVPCNGASHNRYRATSEQNASGYESGYYLRSMVRDARSGTWSGKENHAGGTVPKVRLNDLTVDTSHLTNLTNSITQWTTYNSDSD